MAASSLYLRRLTQEVTLHLRTPGAEDEHGNPAIVESDLIVQGFASRQIATEPAQGQGAVVGESLRLFLDASAPLTGWDAVTVEDYGKYEVIGRPWRVFNPRTAQVHHTEADIRAVNSG
jgi:hypothetical protein